MRLYNNWRTFQLAQILLDQWSISNLGLILKTLSYSVAQLHVLRHELIEFLLSILLLFPLVLDVVVVPDDFIALLPEFLDQLVNGLRFSLDFQLRLFLNFLLLLIFFVQVLFAASDEFLRDQILLFPLSLEIIAHPLHLLDHKVKVTFLLKPNFLSLYLFPNRFSKRRQFPILRVSFILQFFYLVLSGLHSYFLTSFFSYSMINLSARIFSLNFRSLFFGFPTA